MKRENSIKCDIPWLIFFTLIFSFYTNATIQYLAHFYIIIITLLFIRNNITKFPLKKIIYVCGGYFLLVALAMLSRTWAYGIMEGSLTLNGMIKILVIVICLSIYINSKDKLNQVLFSFVYSLAIMSILILITSPLSTYGTTQFGGITKQFRNSIANIDFFAILLVWYFRDKISKKKYNLLTLLFFITGIATGSRRGLIQIIIIGLLFLLTEANLNKKVQRVIMGGIVTFTVLILISNVPFLKSTYLERMAGVFETSISDNSNGDMSAIGRNLYRHIGVEMFKNKPFTGYGIDGFHCYLADHPYTYTTYKLNAVYSHCNYIELLADFGIFGLLFYYLLIHVRIIKCSLKKRKKSRFFRMSTIIIISTLILDYGGISYNTSYSVFMYIILLTGCFLEKSDNHEKNMHCDSL